MSDEWLGRWMVMTRTPHLSPTPVSARIRSFPSYILCVAFHSRSPTLALDIWSAGVILLSLLTKQFPFFNSTDDLDALVELTYIFGEAAMEQSAQRYGKHTSATPAKESVC